MTSEHILVWAHDPETHHKPHQMTCFSNNPMYKWHCGKKFLRETEVSSDKIRIMQEYFSLGIFTDTSDLVQKKKQI